jgi:hypothetical protein
VAGDAQNFPAGRRSRKECWGEDLELSTFGLTLSASFKIRRRIGAASLVSDLLQNLILQHSSIDTFLNHYLDRNINVHVNLDLIVSTCASVLDIVRRTNIILAVTRLADTIEGLTIRKSLSNPLLSFDFIRRNPPEKVLCICRRRHRYIALPFLVLVRV